MILLDTNVLSALMLRRPDKRVVEWLDRLPAESVWTTAVTVFEIRFGIELVATGRRRSELEIAFDAALAEDFQGRVLAFDEAAAVVAGRLGAQQRKAGRAVEIRDLQIAAIALVRRASLATRNVRHFAGLGVDLADPWAD